MAKKNKNKKQQVKKGVSLAELVLGDRYVKPDPSIKPGDESGVCIAEANSIIKGDDVEFYKSQGENMTDDPKLVNKILSIGGRDYLNDLDFEDEREMQCFEEEEEENEDDYIAAESLQGIPAEVADYWYSTSNAGLNAAEKIYEALKKGLEESRASKEKGMTVDQVNAEHRVYEEFSNLALVLRRYKCGKLPKLLKVVPRIKEWEMCLSKTGYRKWTPQALLEITKVFAATAKAPQAQRFYNLFLLPAVLSEISKKGKIHVCTYKSLMKAAFRNKAWVKGILLPVAYDGCSYKDAMVIGSVISKLSFPNDVLYLTLDKLFETRPFPEVGHPQWWAVTSIFICLVLEKNAALPNQVIENAIKFIESFNGLAERPPLIWYQVVIALCERYRERISKTQEQRIRLIIKQHKHPVVSSIQNALAVSTH